jgi:hypothetical protein
MVVAAQHLAAEGREDADARHSRRQVDQPATSTLYAFDAFAIRIDSNQL